MATRLSIKHRKTARDKATAYKKEGRPAPHKVAEERSKKAKYRKSNPN